MLNGTDSAKRLTFFASLCIIALLINSVFYRPMRFVSMGIASTPSQDQPTPKPIDTRKSDEDAEALRRRVAMEAEAREEQWRRDEAAEHGRFLARNINPNVERSPGKKLVAIVAVSENGKFSRTLSTALSTRLQTNSVQFTTSFFTPEFVSDGLFAKTYIDPRETIRRLELANSLDALLFARETVEYTSDPSLENVLTAAAQLEVVFTPVAEPDQPDTWILTASGAGFKQPDARNMAEERLVKEIAKNPKLSVSRLFHNN